MANEGIGSPDREPQSTSRSISQKVSVPDVLGQTVCWDSNNHHAGAHPNRFAICYWLSAIAFEPLARMRRFDVCAARYYALAVPLPRKAAGSTERTWTPGSSRNSALS